MQLLASTVSNVVISDCNFHLFFLIKQLVWHINIWNFGGHSRLAWMQI